MSNFVDEAQVNLRAGDGGAGAVSFRRESHTPKGGPDGGDGGKGGDVWLRANRNVASLLAFRDHPHRRAPSGTHGRGDKRHGAGGADLVVDIPEGTVVRDRDGTVLADLVHHGDLWLAARSGRGGQAMRGSVECPACAFVRAAGRIRRRALAEARAEADGRCRARWLPQRRQVDAHRRGERSQAQDRRLPFTTLVPNLGVVRFHEHEFVVADIPGLVEGAAEGRGLGHQFLRHIERARVLVLLLDLAPAAGPTPAEQEAVLLSELGRYMPELLDRPRLVIGSKADVATEEYDGMRISAATRTGLDELLGQMAELVEDARTLPDAPEPIVVLRPQEDGISIEREDNGVWRVHGRIAERAVAVSDLRDPDALVFVQQRLQKIGVDRALARAGAREGDIVRIGGTELEYEEG